jgi:hypothetical protein
LQTKGQINKSKVRSYHSITPVTLIVNFFLKKK